MVSDLRSILIVQGFLRDEEQISVVMRARGPALDRLCLRVGTTSYIWVDQALPEGKYYPIERLQSVLALCRPFVDKKDLPVYTAFPTLISPSYYVCPGLPSGILLFHRVMAPLTSRGFQASQSWLHLPGVFNALGKYAATLHSLTLPAEVVGKLEHTNPNFEAMRTLLQGSSSSSKETEWSQVEKAFREMLFHYPRLLNAVQSACADYAQTPDRGFLQGSLSLGSIVVSMQEEHQIPPTVFKWLDLWYGPFAYDPGLLLGDLLLALISLQEAVIDIDHDIFTMGKAIITGYVSIRPEYLRHEFLRSIYEYAAWRVVDHLLLNARSFGFVPARVEKMFHQAEILLPQLLTRLSGCLQELDETRLDPRGRGIDQLSRP